MGAGVVGLAVGRALARRGREVIVLESEGAVGTGTSSRNSCVIHAGIYYPKDSNKARLCVAGKALLYELCESHGVSHRRVGKLIVATGEEQLPDLDALRQRAAANGVGDLVPLDPAQTRDLEPEVACHGALLSPSTGIVDVHEFMLALQGDLEEGGGVVALNSPFLSGQIRDGEFSVRVGGAEPMTLECGLLVNAAGLGAQDVARGLQGVPADTIPPLYYAKGNYFYLSGRSPFTHLIYPMPVSTWLGVHVGLDLGGRCRFGPDIHWVDSLDYDVDPGRAGEFYASIRRYWPGLPDGALHPDYTGIRPKLTPAGAPAMDFVIQGSPDHGVKGLVNLFGIESPGLTSSMAIGDHVAQRLTDRRIG